MKTKSTKRRRKASRKHLSPQRTFGFTRREGHRIGRKPSPDSGVPHQTREPLAARFPVHVVLRIDERLPSLRDKQVYQVLRRSFAAGCDRFGFRLNHYSVQGSHLHFIVEANDRAALSRGLKGLTVRIAKGLNKLWSRKGCVFPDRYFDRILRTPLEVKNALRYVLKNGNKHGAHGGPAPDPFSSGPSFTGWRDFTPATRPPPPRRRPHLATEDRLAPPRPDLRRRPLARLITTPPVIRPRAPRPGRPAAPGPGPRTHV